ncbi:MAG: MBL fold metallo-hydrolase RNA specificity domain-containing protein [Anaerolineae bacterium]
MDITFLGAIRSVTGSMHMLQVNGNRILLECGLFQGHRQEAFERNRKLPFDASKVDAMVLSHAHIDHSGNIPNLVRSGFRGSIFSTFATRDLCSLMLRDAAHIMESDIEYMNRKRGKERLPPLEPIYNSEDAIRSLRAFHGIEYGRAASIAPGITLTFRDAGHILGSALCVLDIKENGRNYRLLFTGDLGRFGLLILKDPEIVEDVDYLITESTYGGRLHGTPDQAEAELREVVNKTFKRKGKVIIPAFAVGRTQEVVYTLHRQELSGQIPHIPIYVDSPLAINATEVFRLHPEAYDSETYQFMLKHQDPFGFEQLHYVRQAEDSKAINAITGPIVIVSASGMCESGRILHHLKHNIENPRNTILFVGFQAENTLGNRIQQKQDKVPIFGDIYSLRAEVASIDGYSAHADHDELLGYISKVNHKLQRVMIVHGDEQASLSLQQGLAERGITKTIVPTMGETVTI